MMLSGDGGGCAIYEEKCPQIPGGSGELGRRESQVGCSSPPVRWWESGPGRECRLDRSPAASNISYTEVNGVSRESYIWTDQGKLSKAGSRSCPKQGHFLWDAIFILNFRKTFFPGLLHLSVALGTRIFPAPHRERSLFLASGFMGGCREAVKRSWQINSVSRGRGFFPSFFSC